MQKKEVEWPGCDSEKPGGHLLQVQAQWWERSGGSRESCKGQRANREEPDFQWSKMKKEIFREDVDNTGTSAEAGL